MNTTYNSKERFWLWTLALVSFIVLNTAFIYGLFFEQQLMIEAMKNPLSLAFICESFLMMGALAYLLTKWGVARLHWGWFITLSLLGSMGFALPIVLLWPNKK